jgi:hypothetical protein
VQLISNFVQIKLAEIQNSHDRIDLPLDVANFELSKAIKCRPTAGISTSVDLIVPSIRNKSSMEPDYE